MAAAHTARCAEHEASSTKKNTIGAAKAVAIAAVLYITLTTTKIHSADRRTGMQAGSMHQAYDGTILARLKQKLRKAKTRTRRGRRTARYVPPAPAKLASPAAVFWGQCVAWLLPSPSPTGGVDGTTRAPMSQRPGAIQPLPCLLPPPCGAAPPSLVHPTYGSRWPSVAWLVPLPPTVVHD